jgi:diketogulonate reductase-like aldo/keto reductase
VLHALATGYRHIDTATMYGNETEVGQAMRDSGLSREEIFLTTKLLQDDADNPAQAMDASLRRLGTDYVDASRRREQLLDGTG